MQKLASKRLIKTEVLWKAQAREAACRANAIAHVKVAKLETKIQECIAGQHNFQLILEEANQSSGRIICIFCP